MGLRPRLAQRQAPQQHAAQPSRLLGPAGRHLVALLDAALEGPQRAAAAAGVHEEERPRAVPVLRLPLLLLLRLYRLAPKLQTQKRKRI